MAEENFDTVADLEIYGASKKLIEILDKMGYLYVCDLKRLKPADLLVERNVGEATLANLQATLRNYQAGQTVKSVHECVKIQGEPVDRPKLTRHLPPSSPGLPK